MVKYRYIGDSERVFPSVPITVNKGDEFEAEAGLTAPGLEVVHHHEKKKESKPSASSDLKVGDEING